jgi:hypothetical protein
MFDTSRKDCTMTNEVMQTTLARLETRIAAQERELAVYRTKQRATRRRPRRLLAALALALLTLLVPLAVLAAGPFTDLDPNSPHNANIAAIQAAGITKGCNPPDFTQYCPKDNVTREEMASFIARATGLGGNPPVANALTAINATNAQSAVNAQNAVSAQTAQNAVNAQTAQTVPDGSVTTAKLSSTGATPGQVLVATANGVAFATPGATPIARGFIKGDGTVLSGSGNFTVTYIAASKEYEIAIDGVIYTATDFQTFASPALSNGHKPFFAIAVAALNKLYIGCYDLTGTHAQCENGFAFIVFK